jgi:hypothetical protein
MKAFFKSVLSKCDHMLGTARDLHNFLTLKHSLINKMRLVLVQIISVSKDVVLTKAPRIYLIFVTIKSIAEISSSFNEA